VPPGQAGIIRITIRALAAAGKFEQHHEIYTNDPRYPVIKLTLAAEVKPLPDFLKRIENANVTHGEQAGSFNVWPTARPAVAVEPGERLKIALRIRPTSPDSGILRLATNQGDSYKLRRETSGDGYWLDIEIAAANQASRQTAVIAFESSNPNAPRLSIPLTINIPAENLIVTPKTIDLGELSLASLKSGIAKSSRIGLRKLVGTFQIKSLSATLPFIKLEAQTMVEGSNYLIKVSLISEKLPAAGSYSGTLLIETSDPARLRVEVPLKLTLTVR
jgi:hypothetical protein